MGWTSGRGVGSRPDARGGCKRAVQQCRQQQQWAVATRTPAAHSPKRRVSADGQCDVWAGSTLSYGRKLLLACTPVDASCVPGPSSGRVRAAGPAHTNANTHTHTHTHTHTKRAHTKRANATAAQNGWPRHTRPRHHHKTSAWGQGQHTHKAAAARVVTRHEDTQAQHTQITHTVVVQVTLSQRATLAASWAAHTKLSGWRRCVASGACVCVAGGPSVQA
jgi:hypothetical protein